MTVFVPAGSIRRSSMTCSGQCTRLRGLPGSSAPRACPHCPTSSRSFWTTFALGASILTAAVLDLLFRAVELYGRILQSEKQGKDQPIPEVEHLIQELHQGGGAAAVPEASGQYDLDASLLAVLTEYEEHRLRANIAQGLRLYRLRVQFQLSTIDQALDELKGLAKPHGEIITYLPTGAGADADSIELDILMASHTPEDVLRQAFDGRGVNIKEIPRRGLPADYSTGQVGPRRVPEIPVPSLPAARPPPHPAAAPQSLVPPAHSSVNAPPMPAAKPGIQLGTIRSVAQTVRVDIHKLDHLMNIVGELSIVRTTLARLIDRLRTQHVERELAADVQRLQRTFERQLGAMQQGILEVRMVPLGQVFDKLARVVRQISRDADKLVNLVITGAETEVDKLIVEELSDPLMHMMRNAIDHGIETRADREAVGKPAVGTIALNAFQKGNHVVIEIEDDGKGIDHQKLLDAGVRMGLLSSEEAHSVSREEILNLVFVPGLSTKSDVSELSGRGVGMDVVKTNISKLGGVIDLQSEHGIGTKVTITLPITLAIISALVVRISERLFAIPLANVQEAVVLDPASVRTIDGRELVTLRGGSLQICRLARVFGLEGVVDGPNGWGVESALPDSRSSNVPSLSRAREYVVVTAVGARRLGLVVSTLVGEQDVVIKALGPSLKAVRGFAGASELGDQRIALVIDAPALIEETHAGGDRLRAEVRSIHG